MDELEELTGEGLDAWTSPAPGCSTMTSPYLHQLSESRFLKSALLAIVALQALLVSAEGAHEQQLCCRICRTAPVLLTAASSAGHRLLAGRSPTSPTAHADAQIAYGYDAAKGQFPWVVSVRTASDNKHRCTGTLIKTNVVLTAGGLAVSAPLEHIRKINYRHSHIVLLQLTALTVFPSIRDSSSSRSGVSNPTRILWTQS